MPLPDLIARYREHGLLFGGGLLAGLLMFLIWLSLQPPRKVEAPAEAGTTTAGARGGPSRPADGVLGDFTAGAGPAADSAVIDQPTPDNAAGAQDVADAAAPAAAPIRSDEQAIAEAMLSPEGGEGRPVLQTWYVEVARGPGVSEILEIAAPSADQALVVLRDFRGNPRVLRGPSPQPFP